MNHCTISKVNVFWSIVLHIILQNAYVACFVAAESINYSSDRFIVLETRATPSSSGCLQNEAKTEDRRSKTEDRRPKNEELI